MNVCHVGVSFELDTICEKRDKCQHFMESDVEVYLRVMIK
jgi:hypothetical protein